jgi:hypothetical protein
METSRQDMISCRSPQQIRLPNVMEDLIRCKEVPLGGGIDNKFRLGSDFPLNFTEIGLAGSCKRINVFRQIK